MLTRNQIKFITSLRQKKFRQQHQLFTAEGERLVGELIKSSLKLHALYALSGWIEKNIQYFSQRKVSPLQVSTAEMERLSSFKTPNQVFGIFETPTCHFDSNLIGKEPLLMLDEMQDPGNLGTIMRTADWFGINHIICSKNSADLYNPKTIQATMGSIARVKVYYLDLEEVLKEAKPESPVYGALLSGNPIDQTSILPNPIILIGNEGKGISESLHKYINHAVFIPPFCLQLPGILRPESLNASIATAIFCWELRRNKNKTN